MTIEKNNTIKDYYIRLERMYINVMNMLTSLNQSLVSNSSEVTVTVTDTNDVKSTLRIPSFLYLENKLEELNTNFGALFNIPESGEAWFTRNSSDSYKFNLVRSNTALPAPQLSPYLSLKGDTQYTSIKDNNILKDLVSPLTYIRYNIANLADVTDSIIMKKYVFYNKTLFDYLEQSGDINTYADLEDKLIGYKRGDDYDCYESTLKVPIKKDTYISLFNIKKVDDSDYINTNTIKVTLDTIEYYDSENSSVIYQLVNNDKLVYSDTALEYEITNIDYENLVVTLKELNGHKKIVTTQEQSNSTFVLLNNNYNKYKYVDIPLEENENIAICLSVVYNNIRSIWSKPEFIDLNTIYMKDENGNDIKDENGNTLTYIDYYKKYCNNIGDLILGITETAYPQVSNFTPAQLKDMQSSESITNGVTNTFNGDILKVVPINKHLTDDVTNDDILNLHNQKNQLQSQLDTIQTNIDDTTNDLLNIDKNNVDNSNIITLQKKLTEYKNEKTTITKQFNSCVNQLTSKIAQLNQTTSEIKYRLRGVTVVNDMINMLQNAYGKNVELIGTEIWYKYKSVNKDTTTITVINSDTFSEWNIQKPSQRDRYLVFNSQNTSFVTNYVDYNTLDNTPKWNQVDIPIKNGEDVIVKVRYLYNIGQPFINLYTPWSDEVTFEFPSEYKEDITVKSIIETNNDDTVTATFTNTLINDGYEEHINDKILDNENKFFHTSEHIYSGFNTSENNMLSLYDKLKQISNDIVDYKELLNEVNGSKYQVQLVSDDVSTELHQNTKNKISIYNNDVSSNNKFIKKKFKLVIKNISDYNVKLYSLFPYSNNIPLAFISDETDNLKLANKFYRVPLQVSNVATPQYCGQWIYFRQTNPTTNTSIYYNTKEQDSSDLLISTSQNINNNTYKFSEPLYLLSPSNYMPKNNIQACLPYVYNKYNKIDISSENEQIKSITNALLKLKAFLDMYGDKLIED